MKLWREQPDGWNWKPTAKDKGRFWLGLSLCFFVLAAYAYSYPSLSVPSGRWGWLHRIFFAEFGAVGDVLLYSIVGTAALIAGALLILEKRQ